MVQLWIPKKLFFISNTFLIKPYPAHVIRYEAGSLISGELPYQERYGGEAYEG